MTISPVEVLELRRQALLGRDAAAFADLFAPDGAIEMPFAGPGLPARISGQQAIKEMFDRTTSSQIELADVATTALYRTDDPEVVVVEVLAKGRMGSEGQSFAARSIQIFRIHDGKIVLFRDYFNPAGLADQLLNA